MSSIMVAEYLNEEESSSLGKLLEPVCGNVMVKRHGLPRMFGLDINYRVFVDRKDADKAFPLVAEFQKECAGKREKAKKLLQTQCPACTSTGIRKKEKTSLFDKIRYAGVTVWECKGCGGRWFT
jgi:YgiT-type zinc finger domain-containing protein